MVGAEFVVLTLLWAVGLTRLARRTPSAHHRAITLSILAIALAATINEPPVAAALDRAAGVPDLSSLVRNLGGVAAVVAAWVFASAVTRPELARPYRRPAVYLAGIAVMTGLTALFLTIERLPGPGTFAGERPYSPLVIAFGLVTQALFGAGALRGSVLFWTQARAAGPTPLRAGLRVLSLSAAIALVHVGLRVVCLIPHAFGVRPLDGPGFAAVTRDMLTFALLLFGVGCVLPGFGVVRDYLADYRSLVRLYWLWHALQRAVPGFVLGRAASRLGDRLNPFNVRMRLYRRVIEIRDAQWSLGAPVHPDPVLEAAMLVVALSTAGRGAAWPHLPAPGAPYGPPPEGDADEPGGSPLDSEVTHLIQVAEYFESVFRPPGARRSRDGGPRDGTPWAGPPRQDSPRDGSSPRHGSHPRTGLIPPTGPSRRDGSSARTGWRRDVRDRLTDTM